jgi:hypothetical protein
MNTTNYLGTKATNTTINFSTITNTTSSNINIDNDISTDIKNTTHIKNHLKYLKCSPMEYWSNRIYKFLIALTELKSWPKDEKSSTVYDLFL